MDKLKEYVKSKGGWMLKLAYKLNFYKRNWDDFLYTFQRVRIYKKGIDYDSQWSARLGKKTKDYSYFENYRDEKDKDRADDLYALEVLKRLGCKSVLEIGAGAGRLGLLLKEHGISYCGMDISQVAADQAKQKGLEFYQCDMQNIERIREILKGRKFDCVLSLWAIQLFKNCDEVLEEMFSYAPLQVHSFLNAGHWSYRLRLLLGKFPVFSYSTDENGKHIYPYAYGMIENNWTLNDFASYCKDLGWKAEVVGLGTKFATRTAEMKKYVFFPSLRAGRQMWLIKKL